MMKNNYDGETYNTMPDDEIPMNEILEFYNVSMDDLYGSDSEYE